MIQLLSFGKGDLIIKHNGDDDMQPFALQTSDNKFHVFHPHHLVDYLTFDWFKAHVICVEKPMICYKFPINETMANGNWYFVIRNMCLLQAFQIVIISGSFPFGPTSLVGAYYLNPPDARAIFLHDDLLWNGTCSVTGGSTTYKGGGGHGTNEEDPNFYNASFWEREKKLKWNISWRNIDNTTLQWDYFSNLAGNICNYTPVIFQD